MAPNQEFHKEYVAVSINIYPWQNPMRLGIKVKVTPYDTPGCILSFGRVKLLDKEEINTNTRNCTVVLTSLNWLRRDTHHRYVLTLLGIFSSCMI